MRALLVVNPAATAGFRGRDVLVRTLRSEVKLDVVHTRHRGHAESLAREAVADGLDLVVVAGGDGTVNEVVNGLLHDGPSPHQPVLGVVPGGNANVFARALGLPRDPALATGQLLQALRAGRRRRVGLGRAGDRWFTFCAGLGLDAEVVREVQRRREGGTPASTALFVRAALRGVLTASRRRHPRMRLERPGAPPVGPLYLGVVSNTRPWTYLGPLRLVASPAAGLGTGLDLLASRRVGPLTLAAALVRMSSPYGRPAAGRPMVGLHDLEAFTLAAEEPVAAQLDGDYIGDRQELHFRAVPAALAVLR